MGEERSHIGRRQVLSGTAAGIGSLLIPNTVSARPERGRHGPPEHARALTLQKGKAVPARSKSPVGAGQARAMGASSEMDSERAGTKISIEELAEGLNSAVERGDLEIVGEDEKGVMVRSTGKGGE